jgi:hypothetical protein
MPSRMLVATTRAAMLRTVLPTLLAILKLLAHTLSGMRGGRCASLLMLSVQ